MILGANGDNTVLWDASELADLVRQKRGCRVMVLFRPVSFKKRAPAEFRAFQHGLFCGSSLFPCYGFSQLRALEFFVFRKMEMPETINHPLCGCAMSVIQKITFPL